MGRVHPHRVAPSVFSSRNFLTHRQHIELLARPNFRYDPQLQPETPNLATGPDPIWPISRVAIRAQSSARIAELSTPRQSSTNNDDSKSIYSKYSRNSVSPKARHAKASPRILEMARPKLMYMVGLTVDMQDKLGYDFREKMRNRIMDTLGSSYAVLTLGAQANAMRNFYGSQSRQSPFRPFSPYTPFSACESRTSSLARSISAVQSKEERKFWEEARSRPKQDFTIYQPVPVRHCVPIWRLLPRLETLSKVPDRRKVKEPESNPFKVSPAAIRAKLTRRLQELSRPKVRK